MRALCKDWTEGSPAAFAVIDGVGTWTGDDQLCITQEGHTPLISAWSTVTNWTQKGAPYLWWTGADDAAILQAVVNWGLSAGLLGYGHKVGIVAGDRSSDQTALNQYLLPDLRRAGVTPVVETLAADPSETAETNAEAPLVVQKFKSEGVTDVIPLIPFNAMFPYLGSETSDSYFPKLLLSDYEESISASLGLIPTPYEKALNGQQGVTTETLGGVDDSRPESQGGYDPGVRVLLHRMAQEISAEGGLRPSPGAVHRGARPRAVLVHRHPLVRHGGQRRRFDTSTGGRSCRPCRGSRTSRAAFRRCGPLVPTSSTVRPSTRSSRSTTTSRRPRKCNLTAAGSPRGRAGSRLAGWQPLPTVPG